MKSPTIIGLLFYALVTLNPMTATAAEKSVTAFHWEYAVVKWDGPDRIFYYLPDKFEVVHMKDQGVEVPKDAQAEEFYLAWAATKMAGEGWEAVNLNSRRILFRRPKTQ